MMNEWIISSSVLIAAVLLGRFLLRGKISLRLQYALWGIVLLRLLLPIQIFTSDYGVGSIAQEMDISAPVRQVYISTHTKEFQADYDAYYQRLETEYAAQSKPIAPDAIDKEAYTLASAQQKLNITQLLYDIWFVGMAVAASVIVACNVHLACQLRKRRWTLDVPVSLLPVYVTEAVPTPCMFGLFRPAIYLTPEAARDDQIRAHVLTHELTHYRHLDHIWSVLRSLCLVLHWYNPLVWAAVKVSRADAELACDEGTLAVLGEAHRGEYGRTLIGLTCTDHGGSMFITATTMTGSAGSLRERIRLLMQRPRNTVLTLTAVILLVTLIVACTFSAAPETTPPATEPTETTEPTEPVETQPNRGNPEMIAFFQSLLEPYRKSLQEPYHNWYAQALTSYYNSPAEIDLFQLFYNGFPGVDNTPSTKELAFLENQPGYNPDFDLIRLPVQEMERILNQYLGIDTSQALGLGLENFMCDLDTGCYYHSHTDTNASRPTVTAAYELPNGNWQILYTDGFLGNGAVILCEQDGTWKIVSHLPIETIEDFHLQQWEFIYALPMEQAMADYADKNPRELTEKELKEFRAAFATLDENGNVNPAACFLLPYYDEIYEMDGSEFLAYFPTDLSCGQEDFELLKAKYPEFFHDWTWETMPMPIHRYDPKAIEAVVSRYGNIHWQELSEGVHYLEETGCYYNYTSDFGLGGFYAREGFVFDGGAVVYSDFSALFFTDTMGSYTIRAHLPILYE